MIPAAARSIARACQLAALAMLALPMPSAASAPDLAAYMKARAADADGAVASAARDYALALAAAPDDPVVAIRAYREAVQAGDLTLADRALATLSARDVAPADAALLAIAVAAQKGDRPAAAAAIARLDQEQLRILAAPLRAWAALEAGSDPLAPLAAATADPVSKRLAAETRALVLIATGRTAEGLAALTALLGNDLAAQDQRIAAARLLIGRGETAQARALLVGDEPQIAALRAKVEAAADARGGAAQSVRPSLAFGASHLFTRVASDLAVGRPGPLSFTLLQAALHADPGNDRARMLLSGLLAKDGALDRALVVLDQVPPDSIYAGIAASGRVQMLVEGGRDADALAVAERTGQAAEATTDDVQRLADLYVRLDRPADAVPLYRRLLDRAGQGAGWTEWLQYGAALDEAGQWPAARQALERAAALAPGEPLVLNYLGYALTEHREQLAKAQRLLEKAAALKPDDAAISDSLGWALFVRGRTARALPLIEQAVAADPANAEIGEHLGDVYWRLGRRYEARYAWTAARESAATADAARLAGKIADGL